MNTVPQKLINYAIHNSDLGDFLGLADVTLPKLDAMTSTVSGAGIGGEVDEPTIGHFKSMELTLNWRTHTRQNVLLSNMKNYNLDIRAAEQYLDAGAGSYGHNAIKVLVRGTPKTTDLGKLSINSTADNNTVLELNYIKITIDDKEVLEIDKYNMKYVVNGVDQLSDVRRALGI
ncbi:phage major tail tube protein [uncultured Acidaminococcus sp.]|uniref:phage major tail tube protein n=1 Tax=uncultured Acidaminococcus sp. TaxID=352152 RepID=UPI0026DCAB64|nr:phage major tail tube protein [uncultured Acidaminococcus sp.]